nr:hypothetical protein [Tanacetum cinerariifolium]
MMFSLGSMVGWMKIQGGIGCVVSHLDLQNPRSFEEGLGAFLDGWEDGCHGVRDVWPNVQSEVVVVDVRTSMGNHPCLKQEGCATYVGDGERVCEDDVVCEVLLQEVDFKGSCSDESDLSLGVGEVVLSFWFSSLDVSSHGGDLVMYWVILDEKCDQNKVEDGDYKVKVMLKFLEKDYGVTKERIDSCFQLTREEMMSKTLDEMRMEEFWILSKDISIKMC